MNPPIYYDYINREVSQFSPNTVKTQNTGLVQYFANYLLQKAMSVFEWKLPDNWDKSYFLYSLYTYGFVAVFDSKKYGVIPQMSGLSGYNVFYRPTKAVIANALLPSIGELKIGTECAIVKLQPNYRGIMDLVLSCAEDLALLSESASINAFNTRVAYVFTAGSKAGAESFKKAFDKISSGDPMVVIDKALMQTESGSVPWQLFNPSVKNTYIVDEIYSDMRKREARFDTDIGIPNANTDKRERLVTDEVNANNVETFSKCALWLEELQHGLEEVKRLFGVEVSVDWRKWEGGIQDESDSVDPRSV